MAIALGCLVWAPQLLTWVADDPAGHDISRRLAESGLDLDERGWGAQGTASARADIDGNGVPAYTDLACCCGRGHHRVWPQRRAAPAGGAGPALSGRELGRRARVLAVGGVARPATPNNHLECLTLGLGLATARP